MRHRHQLFTTGIAVLGAVLLVGFLPVAKADGFVFTGKGADHTSWNDPANWDPLGIAGFGDDVQIHRRPEGAVRVTFQNDVTVNSLDLGEGGSLTGFSITTTSGLDWTGGAFLPTINVILPPGSFTFASGSDTKLLDSSIIDNGGTFTFTEGTIRLDEGAGLNNTGTITASYGVTFTGLVCCAGVNLMPINTTGKFVVTPSLLPPNPSGTVTVFNLAFNASGTVEVQGGVLDLKVGPSNLGAGVRFTGAGRTRISQFTARNVTLNGPVNLAKDSTLELANAAALGGTGTFTGGGTFNWTGGEINGDITIDAGTSLLINGPDDKFLSQAIPPLLVGGTLTNNGTGTFTGPCRLVLGGPVTFHNGGTFTARDGVTFFSGGCCVNPPVLNNSGTFISDLGTGFGFVALSGGVALINSGMLSVNSGMLSINLIGYEQNAGSTILAGGTLASQAGVAIRGGELLGTGDVKASLTNAGTVRPGPRIPANASGILTVMGDYTQTAAGTLQVNINEPTVGTGYDRLVVTGAAKFDGTLVITTGAAFPANSTFSIVTCPGINLPSVCSCPLSDPTCTTFRDVVGINLPGGGSYRVVYLATGVTLFVTDMAVKTVMLDAGHGYILKGNIFKPQRDPEPPLNLIEDDLTLDMTQQAKSLLEPDYIVLMTRTRPTAPFAPPNCPDQCNIDLDKRRLLAEYDEVDIFVSIHTNAGFDKEDHQHCLTDPCKKIHGYEGGYKGADNDSSDLAEVLAEQLSALEIVKHGTGVSAKRYRVLALQN